MDTVFDRDTAVTRRADRAASENGHCADPKSARFQADVATGWRAGRGPHGGYLAAIMLRALTETVGDAERTPRSLTIHYTAPPEPGPLEIRTVIERHGRSLSTLSGRMEQGGRLTALALAAFSVPWQAPGANELPMPELPGPDPERRSGPKLFQGAPEFTRRLVMQPRVGAVPFAGSGAPMRVGGWTGLPEPRPVDALALALFCDAWFPPSFIALDEPAISPTVDLTIHFRQSIAECDCDPAALCLSVFDTRLLHDGLFEEDGVIWAPDGTVLAQSRQLGIIMPTDKPVLQPSPPNTDRSKHMSDYTAKRIGDMEAAFGGGFVKARAELGVTSFGMQVIQMPPNYEDYPLHDHAESGQEEVFLALQGSGWIDIEGQRVDLEPDLFVRVGPAPKRKVFAGPEGLRMLALGGTPGNPYEIVQLTELTVESPPVSAMEGTSN